MNNKLRIILILFVIIAAGIILIYQFLGKSNTQAVEGDKQKELEKFKALPYMSWTDSKADQSVPVISKYKPDLSEPGYNLYLNEIDSAYLMDMEGNISHTWTFPQEGRWEYAVILDNGDLLAICVGKELIRLDWNSNIIWRNPVKAHHDIEICGDGSFLVPITLDAIEYNSFNVIFDAVLRMSPEGKILDRWSTLESQHEISPHHPSTALDKKLDADLTAFEHGLFENTFDYFHLNSVKLLPENPLGAEDNRFRAGNWLVSLRNISLLLILDQDTKEVLWHWGPGIIDNQHSPNMLENGDILLFDNGRFRDYSRVIQLNPLTGEITWEYRGRPHFTFYSKFRGHNQRLSNGNTLITESSKGRVIEVTPETGIVWEFFNPELNEEGHRKLVYRMVRYPLDYFHSLLETDN